MCKYSAVDRDLFNAAFLSCWSELSEDQQDELIRSIELALTSQDIAEVTQTLLNLAEFMEHSDKVRINLSFGYYYTAIQHSACSNCTQQVEQCIKYTKEKIRGGKELHQCQQKVYWHSFLMEKTRSAKL